MNPILPALPTDAAFPLHLCERHLERLTALTTFEEAQAWDHSAKEMVRGAQKHLRTLQTADTHLAELYRTALAEHQNKSFLARLFTSPTEANRVRFARTSLNQHRSAIEAVIDELNGAIDKTPDSREEKKAMIADLRMLRKELVLRKREASTAMRDVREAATAANARVGTGWDALLSTPSSRRFDRMGIRLRKEAALTPHRSARNQIEQELAVIDRHLLWLEKIK